MWHTPNQRFRALANARKKDRDKPRRSIHIRRITAFTLPILPDIPNDLKEEVRLLLNDFTVKGAGFFSKSEYVSGTRLQLIIAQPIPLQVESRVIWCREHAPNSHILSQEAYSYRVGVEFILSPDGHKSVQKFYEEISRSYLYVQNAA